MSVSPWSMALVFGAAFLAGGIPFGLLLVRWVAGRDIREVGSGNIGATNAARALGFGWGLGVFLLDAAKGFLPVLLVTRAPAMDGAGAFDAALVKSLAAVGAVLGHVFSPFLAFRGGRGAATGAGAFLALAPGPMAAAMGVWALLVAVFRYISLGSILAALALPPLCWALLEDPFGDDRPILAAALLGAALVAARHAANIRRLFAGIEPRIGQKK